jgi:hypothetical protein
MQGHPSSPIFRLWISEIQTAGILSGHRILLNAPRHASNALRSIDPSAAIDQEAINTVVACRHLADALADHLAQDQVERIAKCRKAAIVAISRLEALVEAEPVRPYKEILEPD